LWYEQIRPTAPKMIKQEKATELDWARNFPQNTQIWGGRPMNVLLQSCLTSSQPTSGPYISLDPSTLHGLNLNEQTTRANLALAKDNGKIFWTEALQEEAFDSVRDEFSKNFASAIKMAQSGDPPPVKVVRELRKDLDAMSTKLDDEVQTLTPTAYIQARRLLTQLKTNVQGLSNPRVVKSADATWKKNVRTVADLVGFCAKNGMEFGPAMAPGDYPSYTAAYYAIRNYERGMWQSPGQ
jgi:hypothetical protein